MDRLANSQLLNTGLVSQVVIVSPREPHFAASGGSSLSFGEDARCTWIPCPWGSRNEARNRGHRAATGDFVYHLDDDVEPVAASVLESALARMAAENLVWLGGPYANPRGLSLVGRVYNFLSNSWARTGERGGCGYALQSAHDLFLGGNVLCRRGSFRWPEHLRGGGEEIVIARELHLGGSFGVFDSCFRAPHYTCHTWRSLLARLRAHEKSESRSLREGKWRKLGRLVFGVS